MQMSYAWSMPNHNTFEMKPVAALLSRYLSNDIISVDPFARNSSLATYTNDLNPDTTAIYHMKALDFLIMMRDEKYRVDLVLFDPPYSLRQTKEVYESIGVEMQYSDTVNVNWYAERDAIDAILVPGGHVISFGWNSIGMGKRRGYEKIEILLICHGRAHNDTICLVERKVAPDQLSLEV